MDTRIASVHARECFSARNGLLLLATHGQNSETFTGTKLRNITLREEAI